MVAGGGVVQPFKVFQKKDELSTYGFSIPRKPQNTKQKRFCPQMVLGLVQDGFFTYNGDLLLITTQAIGG